MSLCPGGLRFACAQGLDGSTARFAPRGAALARVPSSPRPDAKGAMEASMMCAEGPKVTARFTLFGRALLRHHRGVASPPEGHAAVRPSVPVRRGASLTRQGLDL